MDIELTASRLQALGHPTRLAVYRLLVRAGATGLPVGEVQARTNLPGSTLTHHLKRLIATGLAQQERRGTVLICRMDQAVMQHTLGELMNECCADLSQSDFGPDGHDHTAIAGPTTGDNNSAVDAENKEIA